MKQITILRTLAVGALCASLLSAKAKNYYVDNSPGGGGSDSNPGTITQPWQTLAKVSGFKPQPGDSILLKCGDTFWYPIRWNGITGGFLQYITIGSYGAGASPVINGQGYTNCIGLTDCSFIGVTNITLTAYKGSSHEANADIQRKGIYIASINATCTHIDLENDLIENIYSTSYIGTGRDQWGSTRSYDDGTAIFLDTPYTNTSCMIEVLSVDNCDVENVAISAINGNYRYGGNHLYHIFIQGCVFNNIGGPGVYLSGGSSLVYQSNTSLYTGSSAADGQLGTGSHLWYNAFSDVLVQQNTFIGARGSHDSVGIHLDVNNSKLIYQYNYSYDNAGGFFWVEGGVSDAVARYNLSVDDGWRQSTSGVQAGQLLSFFPQTSGRNNRIYFYNNTVYDSTNQANFGFANNGVNELLLENNVFYLTESAYVTIANATGNANVVRRANNGYPTELPTLPGTINPVFGYPYNPEFDSGAIGWPFPPFRPLNTDLSTGGLMIVPFQDDPSWSAGNLSPFSVVTDALGKTVNNNSPGLGAMLP